MKTYQKQLAIGLLLLAVLQKVLGQSEGLDDRYRTEDTFREPDNRPGQAFDTFEKQTTDLVPKKGATKGGVTIYEVQVKPAVEGLSMMVQPNLGYESNPNHGQSQHGAMLYGVNETLGYNHITANRFLIGLNHTFKGFFYNHNQLPDGSSTASADGVQNKISLPISWIDLNTNWLLSVNSYGTHTIVNGSPTSQTAGVSPAVAFKWPVANQWAASSLSFNYDRFNDLTVQSNPELIDQADEHSFEMDTSFFTRGILGRGSNLFTSVTLAYAHKWHDSSGAFREYQDNNVSLEFKGYVGDTNLQYGITYTHDWKGYDANGTAYAGGPNRNDSSDDILVTLTWNLKPVRLTNGYTPLKASLILSCDYQTKNSNKATVVYGDHTVFAGLNLKF